MTGTATVAELRRNPCAGRKINVFFDDRNFEQEDENARDQDDDEDDGELGAREFKFAILRLFCLGPYLFSCFFS
jgi:hypothetical protein